MRLHTLEGVDAVDGPMAGTEDVPWQFGALTSLGFAGSSDNPMASMPAPRPVREMTARPRHEIPRNPTEWT